MKLIPYYYLEFSPSAMSWSYKLRDLRTTVVLLRGTLGLNTIPAKYLQKATQYGRHSSFNLTQKELERDFPQLVMQFMELT